MIDRSESIAAAVCVSLIVVVISDEITGRSVAPTLLAFAGFGLLLLLLLFEQHTS